MTPNQQKAILQSELNNDYADLRLKYSGHRLGPVPPCPVLQDEQVEPQSTSQPVVKTEKNISTESYYDTTKDNTITKDTATKVEKPSNDLLTKGLIGLAAAAGMLGSGYVGSMLNKPVSRPDKQVVVPSEDKEGDWLGALRRKGDNLPPAGAAK